MPMTIDLPFTPEDVKAGKHIDAWDRWYGTLPDDLKRKLSIHDFKRLGDCFKMAFGLQSAPPAAHGCVCPPTAEKTCGSIFCPRKTFSPQIT